MLPAPGEPLIRPDAPAGLFLSRAGTWYEDGQAVTHPRLAALLTRCIARDEEARLIVTTGRDRRPFVAEDAPQHATALLLEQDGAALLLADSAREPLSERSLVLVDAQGRMRLPVKRGAYWAILSRSAAHALGARLLDDGETLDLPGARARLVLDEAPRDWSARPALTSA